MIHNPIFIALSPNTEKDDAFLALRLLFSPWKWKRDKAVSQLENEFKHYLGIKHTLAFNSGRTALMAILNALELEPKSEVLIQAFTCNALVNPIKWAGLKPAYVDIDKKTLNMNVHDLEQKITSKSRVVIAQHTFGNPADIDRIKEICKKYNLILLEDCAHALGAEYQGQKVGTFGRAGFFSLGRNKMLSSVYGGVAVTSDDDLAQKIRKFQKDISTPSNTWIVRQLFHPILCQLLIKPLFSFSKIGAGLLFLFQKIGLISKAVDEKEKNGVVPAYFPGKMPSVLAELGIKQMQKLERFIEHGKELARIYKAGLSGLGVIFPSEKAGRIYMRYSILAHGLDANKIRKRASAQKIFLDDGWHTTPIVPPGTILKNMEYEFGMCACAEEVAQEILNLPTNINTTKKDAERIIEFLKSEINGNQGN